MAREVGADAVAHGCTGKGNDQACFKIVSAVDVPVIINLTQPYCPLWVHY